MDFSEQLKAYNDREHYMKKIQPPHTNESIKKLFAEYKAKYFGGNLAVLYVRFDKLPAGYIGHTKVYRSMFRKGPDSYGISLDNSLKKTTGLLRGTLLHEMVHVELNLAGVKHLCGDGKSTEHQRFNHRMFGLAELGAFHGIW